jgi:hypothetical protein
MKTPKQIERRALRILSAALLNSDLSDSDLADFASTLDMGFILKLRRTLVAHMPDERPPMIEAEDNLTVEPVAKRRAQMENYIDLIYEQVRLKKLGRDRLLRIMGEYWQGTRNFPSLSRESSIAQIIRLFVEGNSLDQSQLLMMRLAGNIEEDSYLKGITKR